MLAQARASRPACGTRPRSRRTGPGQRCPTDCAQLSRPRTLTLCRS
ncbi:hypothetical protein SFR_0348 [Streptomyces sp. FR-008]|nr:hypothetical protein SFR_0348 [Streptomyces sp. FR-008]